MSAWATISETLAYTRINVEQEDIDAAQVMIEIFVDCVYNQTVDASGSPLIGSKNLRLLKMAVAYQAAWMTQHPDLFTHTDIQSINQDGIFYVHQHENSYLLAPMARRAIKRLSWNRNKSIRVRPGTNRVVRKYYVQDDSSIQRNVSYWGLTAEQEDNIPWESM